MNDDGFFSDRTFRLNYFAVKALLARVYMWEGSDASIALARQEASDVIREGERLGLYQWVTTDLVSTDPIHSTEHITSLNIPAFTDRLTDYYLYNFLEGTAYEAIKLRIICLIFTKKREVGKMPITVGKSYSSGIPTGIIHR